MSHTIDKVIKKLLRKEPNRTSGLEKGNKWNKK